MLTPEICEIQPVTVQEPSMTKPDSTPVLEEIEMDKEDLTTEEIRQGLSIIAQFNNTFTKKEIDLGHSSMAKHRIEIYYDIPFKQRYLRIPPGMFDDIRSLELLDLTVAVGHPILYSQERELDP